MPGGRLRAYSSAASAAASACSKSSLSSLTSLPSALGASELSDGPSSSRWLASESEAASASGKGHWGLLMLPGGNRGPAARSNSGPLPLVVWV